MQDTNKIPPGQPNSTPVSVYWELRWLLLAGIFLFSAGIGGLLYESEGSLVHKLAVAGVAGLSIACFLYGSTKKSAFSAYKVEEQDHYFDFIILLAALSFVTTIAYLQFRFNFFGTKYGLATFIPMVILFFMAYYFDHAGVLGMAIGNLVAWAGIFATPHVPGLLSFSMSGDLIFTGLALSILLETSSLISEKRNFKAHFASVYRWAAINLAFISVLFGMFQLHLGWWTIVLFAFAYYYYRMAVLERSFGYLLAIGIYLFIGCGYHAIRFIERENFSGMMPAYLGIFYFLGSSALFAIFLVKQFKRLKHDRV